MLSRIEYQSDTNQTQLLKDLCEIAQPIMFNPERGVTNIQLFNAVRFVTVNRAAIKKLVDSKKLFSKLFKQIYKDDADSAKGYLDAAISLCNFLDLLYTRKLYYRLFDEIHWDYKKTLEAALISMLNPFILATEDKELLDLLDVKSRFTDRRDFYFSESATRTLQNNLNSKNGLFQVLIEIENAIETGKWTSFHAEWNKLLNIFKTFENYLKNSQNWENKFKYNDTLPKYKKTFGPNAMFTDGEYRELYERTLLYFFQMIQRRPKPLTVEEQNGYLRILEGILEASFSQVNGEHEQFNGEHKKNAFSFLKEMVVDLRINNMQASFLLAKMYLNEESIQSGAQTAKGILEQLLFPSNENNASNAEDEVAAPPEMVQFYVENFDKLSKSTMNPDSDERITTPAKILIRQLSLSSKPNKIGNMERQDKLLAIIKQFANNEGVSPIIKLDLVSACLDTTPAKSPPAKTMIETVESILKAQDFEKIEKCLTHIKNLDENSEDRQKVLQELQLLLNEDLNKKYVRLKKNFHVQNGKLHAYSGNYERAKEEFEQALRIPETLENPNNETISFWTGEMYYHLKDYDAAIEKYGYHDAYLAKAKIQKDKNLDDFYHILNELYEKCLSKRSGKTMVQLITMLIERTQYNEPGFHKLQYQFNKDEFIQFLRSDITPKAEALKCKYNILEMLFENKIILPEQLPAFLKNLLTFGLSLEERFNLLRLVGEKYSAELVGEELPQSFGNVFGIILNDEITIDEEGAKKYTQLKDIEKSVGTHLQLNAQHPTKRKLMEEVSVACEEAKKSSSTFGGLFGKKSPLQNLGTRNLHANLLIQEENPNDPKIYKEISKNIINLADIDSMCLYSTHGKKYYPLLRAILIQWANDSAKDPKIKAPTMLTAIIAMIYQPKSKTLFEGLDFIKNNHDMFLEALKRQLELITDPENTGERIWSKENTTTIKAIIEVYPGIAEKLSRMVQNSFGISISSTRLNDAMSPGSIPKDSEELQTSNPIEKTVTSNTEPTKESVKAEEPKKPQSVYSDFTVLSKLYTPNIWDTGTQQAANGNTITTQSSTNVQAIENNETLVPPQGAEYQAPPELLTQTTMSQQSASAPEQFKGVTIENNDPHVSIPPNTEYHQPEPTMTPQSGSAPRPFVEVPPSAPPEDLEYQVGELKTVVNEHSQEIDRISATVALLQNKLASVEKENSKLQKKNEKLQAALEENNTLMKRFMKMFTEFTQPATTQPGIPADEAKEDNRRSKPDSFFGNST